MHGGKWGRMYVFIYHCWLLLEDDKDPSLYAYTFLHHLSFLIQAYIALLTHKSNEDRNSY